MARPPAPPSHNHRFFVFGTLVLVVAVVWLAAEVLIPLALAVLVSFLLAPVVTRLERLRLGRVGSVVIVMLALTAAIGGLGYVVSSQTLALAENLDKYRDNIINKVKQLKPDSGMMDKLSDLGTEVERNLSQPATTQATSSPAEAIAAEIATATDTPRVADTSPDATPAAQAAATQPYSADNPLPVAVIQPRASPLSQLAGYLGLVLGPLGTAGIVLVFVVFMLLEREDLRDRMVRLVGFGQLNVTTKAVDDATGRISRYLLAQAIVNGTYGAAIALGLWLIGLTLGDQAFPSVILWGLLCGVLRFIPYIGPWLAAIFPLAIAFAVYPGFGVFLATMGLFVVIELVSNNFMEPWLYGTSTGLSTIAILASAVFWTWLWGPVGLVMATPLTVCIVVLGKYVPSLQFLDIMLGDDPVFAPPERVYQRLLALDQEEATEIADEYLTRMPIEQVYDTVLMPALAMAEQDRHRGKLDDDRAIFIRAAFRDLVDELGDRQQVKMAEGKDEYASVASSNDTGLTADADQSVLSRASKTAAAAKAVTAEAGPTAGAKRGSIDVDFGTLARPMLPKDCTINVLVLPSHDEADEIVGLMLAQVLALRGYCATAVSVTALAGEMVEMVERQLPHVVVVSAMPPAAVTHSRYLCKRLHARFPELKMIVGLWTYRGDMKKAVDRVTCVDTVAIETTLADALDAIHQRAQPLIVNQNRATAEAEADAG